MRMIYVEKNHVDFRASKKEWARKTLKGKSIEQTQALLYQL